MNQEQIAALMRGVAPVVRDLVATTIKPFGEEIASLRAEIAELRAINHLDAIAKEVSAAIAAMPPAQAGKDADPADVAAVVRGMIAPELEAIKAAIPEAPKPVELPDFDELIGDRVKEAFAALETGLIARTPNRVAVEALVGEVVAEAVAAIPPPQDGKSVDPSEVEAMVAKAVAEIPPAKDGNSVTIEQVEPVLAEMVREAVAAIPIPKDGQSVTTDDVAPMVRELVSTTVAEAVAAIPAPKDGAPGKLPIAKAWEEDGVVYEAEVRTHNGALWQALRDTGRAPGHEDWICLAARGDDGKDADLIEVCGTYDPDKSYGRLNIVAMNGGAFISRKATPGPCPGEDWQVIAMRGKPGPSVKGDKGDKGNKGDAGPGVVALSMSGEGLLSLVNGDGSLVECDMYPVLSKLNGAS